MGKPYRQDLRSLNIVMQTALDADVTGLSQFLKSAGDLTLQCIASGGSLAAAEFCSMLHQTCSGRMAKHTTPYEAALSAPLPGCAQLLISGGGNNPDILNTAQMLIQKAIVKRIQIPMGALCASVSSRLADALGKNTRIPFNLFAYDLPTGRDGFLATGSLLLTMTVLARAYAAAFGRPDIADPDRLAAATDPRSVSEDPNTERLLRKSYKTIIILSGGAGRPAMTDFESRCHERGLASVMTCDYRNFAHGRHQFITEHRRDILLISLETPLTEPHAGELLAHLPTDTDLLRYRVAYDGAPAAIALVVKSMRLAATIGKHKDMDPGNPRVSEYGRAMYAADTLRRVQGSAI